MTLVALLKFLRTDRIGVRDTEGESSTTTAFVSRQTKILTLSLILDLQFPFDVSVDLLNSVWVVRPERIPYVGLIFYR